MRVEGRGVRLGEESERREMSEKRDERGRVKGDIEDERE